MESHRSIGRRELFDIEAYGNVRLVDSRVTTLTTMLERSTNFLQELGTLNSPFDVRVSKITLGPVPE
jgi:hypothetical protein